LIPVFFTFCPLQSKLPYFINRLLILVMLFLSIMDDFVCKIRRNSFTPWKRKQIAV